MDLSFLKALPIVSAFMPNQPPPQIPLAGATPSFVPDQPQAPQRFGWLDTLRNDPNAKRAMLAAGLNMLAAPRGSDSLSTIARGAAHGLNYYDTKTKADADARMQAEKDKRALEKADEDIATARTNNQTLGQSNEAELRKKQADAREAEGKVTALIQKAESDAAVAKTDAEKAAIELGVKRRIDAIVAANPELEKSAIVADYKNKALAPVATQANIDQSKAAAASSSATAARTKNLTEMEKLDTEDYKNLTPEQRKAQREATSRGGTPTAIQVTNAYMNNWDVLNPAPPSNDVAATQRHARKRAQAYNEQLVKNTQVAKMNEVSQLNAILMNSAPGTPAYENAMARLNALNPQVGTEEGGAGARAGVGSPQPAEREVEVILQNGKFVPRK